MPENYQWDKCIKYMCKITKDEGGAYIEGNFMYIPKTYIKNLSPKQI